MFSLHTNLRSLVVEPFQNLSTFEKTIFILRLTTALLSFIFGMVTILGPTISPVSFYVSRFEFSTTNIKDGILTYLEKVNYSGDIVSTSALLLFGDYANQQIQNTPRYITFSLTETCVVGYSDSIKFDYDGNPIIYADSFLRSNCTHNSISYVFDYREALIDFKLIIPYSFVYGQINQRDSKKSSDSYYNFLDSAARNKKAAMIFLFISIVFEFLITLLTPYYYFTKGKIAYNTRDFIMVHFLSTMTFITLISGLTGCGLFAWLNWTIKVRINEELGQFGLSLHLGKSWFTCLGIFTGCIFCNSFFWCGLEWCITNVEVINIEEISGERQNILNYKPGVITNFSPESFMGNTNEIVDRSSNSKHISKHFLNNIDDHNDFSEIDFDSIDKNFKTKDRPVELETIELDDLSKWDTGDTITSSHKAPVKFSRFF